MLFMFFTTHFTPSLALYCPEWKGFHFQDAMDIQKEKYGLPKACVVVQVSESLGGNHYQDWKGV